MEFGWDGANIVHISRHDVQPSETVEAITDPHALSFQAAEVAGEVRYGLIGATVDGRVLVVIYTWRGDLCRVVTAFPATPRQQRFYMERSQ
ncbi:MAG: BrnT family toxin [Chloroflexota bacterium]